MTHKNSGACLFHIADVFVDASAEDAALHCSKPAPARSARFLQRRRAAPVSEPPAVSRFAFRP